MFDLSNFCYNFKLSNFFESLAIANVGLMVQWSHLSPNLQTLKILNYVFRCASISRISYDHHSVRLSARPSLTPSHFSPDSDNLT